MKEIAELSGVSRATVSAVLNAKPGVTEKTRRKVLEVIREHDLQHRMIARSLMGHFSQMFAVVVPDINNPFYTEMMAGFMGALKSTNNHVICHPTDGSQEDEIETLRALLGYDLGGYVLSPTQKERSVAHLQQVIDAGKPLVIIGNLPGFESHRLEFQDREGSRKATDYLIERGHEQIVCLAGLFSSTASKERVLGFVESLLSHGTPFDDSMVVWTDSTSEDGYREGLKVLRDRDPRPTALVCFNDAVAMGVYRAAHELGLHIPDDLSVVGFDDIELARLLGPPLTTVSVRPGDIGKMAAEILVAATRGDYKKGQFISKTIHATLAERASVASIKKSSG